MPWVYLTVGIMKAKSLDHILTGMAIGVISPILGFVIYGTFWGYYHHRSLSYFVNEIFLGAPVFQSGIVSLSLVINLLPFWLFIKSDRLRSARGVLAALFVYVPLVIYLRFYY